MKQHKSTGSAEYLLLADEDLLVQVSQGAMFCVLEQDTLSSA